MKVFSIKRILPDGHISNKEEWAALANRYVFDFLPIFTYKEKRLIRSISNYEIICSLKSGSYDKPYSSGHKFSIIITGFTYTSMCDFEQANLATFDPQNGDF